MRRLTCLLCVVLAGSLGSPIWCLDAFFVETFDGLDQSSSLEGYDGFVILDGKIQRQLGDPGDQDRAYMAPPAPFRECGLDKSNDELGCEEYPACVGG